MVKSMLSMPPPEIPRPAQTAISDWSMTASGKRVWMEERDHGCGRLPAAMIRYLVIKLLRVLYKRL
jgi:hypothetical protein